MFYEKYFRFRLLKKSKLSSLLLLPDSFFKVFPLPQKVNCFHRFHIPAWHSNMAHFDDLAIEYFMQLVVLWEMLID